MYLCQNGLLSYVTGNKQQTYYFNNQTKTIVYGIKKNDYITHMYITSHNSNPIASFVKNMLGLQKNIYFGLKNLKIKHMCQIVANDNETLFICRYIEDNGCNIIVFNTLTHTALSQYFDYCFGENDDELYVTDIGNLYVLNTVTNNINAFLPHLLE